MVKEKLQRARSLKFYKHQEKFIQTLAKARFGGTFNQALRFLIEEAIHGKGIVWEK